MNRTACLGRFSDTWGKDAALLGLRLFAAYEFWEAGIEKWNGQNWLADIQSAFPFNLFSAGFNWTAATGIELVAPLLLLFGRAGAQSRFIKPPELLCSAPKSATARPSAGHESAIKCLRAAPASPAKQ